MPTYDVACIARRQASNKKMNKLTSRLAKDLKKKGGVIRKISHYGQRPLAYPIHRKGQKHDVGRYTRYFVQTSPQGLKEFLTTLRLDEDVIRYKPFKMTPGEFMEQAERPAFKHKPKISEAHYDALRRTTNINYYIARTLLMQGKISIDELQSLGTHPVRFEPYFKSREQDLAERVFKAREVLEGISRSDDHADGDDDDDDDEFSEWSSSESSDYSSDHVSGGEGSHSSEDSESSKKEASSKRSAKTIRRQAREERLRKIRNQYQSDKEYADHELLDVAITKRLQDFRDAFDELKLEPPSEDFASSSEAQSHYSELEKFGNGAAAPGGKKQKFVYTDEMFDPIMCGLLVEQIQSSDSDSSHGPSDAEFQDSGTRAQSKHDLFRQIDEFTELSEDVEGRAAARRFNHLNLSGDEDNSQHHKNNV
jgi:ribosomal protein S6